MSCHTRLQDVKKVDKIKKRLTMLKNCFNSNRFARSHQPFSQPGLQPTSEAETSNQCQWKDLRKISKKPQQICQKSFKIPQNFVPKWRKSEPGGTLKRRQEAKMIKNVVVSNSVMVFKAILVENGFQDGCQNRAKINKKVT